MSVGGSCFVIVGCGFEHAVGGEMGNGMKHGHCEQRRHFVLRGCAFLYPTFQFFIKKSLTFLYNFLNVLKNSLQVYSTFFLYLSFGGENRS